MPFQGDPLAFYGRHIIEENDAAVHEQLPADHDLTVSDPLDVSDETLHSFAVEEYSDASLLEQPQATGHNLPQVQYSAPVEARGASLIAPSGSDSNVSTQVLRYAAVKEQGTSLVGRLHPDFPSPWDRPPPWNRFNIPTELPKVGILGAGVGGLYTALILDSLGIECEILEASNRTGGRLSTFKFPSGGKYDYYDAGAMRFPLPKKDASTGKYKNGIMKRLGDLIEYGPLNEGSDPLREKLIPYYYQVREDSEPGFYYFNLIHEDVSKKHKGSFNAVAMGVPTGYILAGADAITKDVTEPFVRAFIEGVLAGDTSRFWNMMKTYDLYSVRAYMATTYRPSAGLSLLSQPLPNNVINWCSLLDGSSGGYDRALTEAVFSKLAFAKIDERNNYGDVDWKCFEGGSETLSKKMEEYIRKLGVSIQFQSRVTAVRQAYSSIEMGIPFGTPCVEVTVNGTKKKKYSHVISTLPLPVLRTVDLSKARLSVIQRNALRALDYGPAIKIAILFRSNWWTTKLGIIGGQSFTDLPIRTIVYPSYSVDSDTPSKVLIASYTWTTDAHRLSALASNKVEGELEGLKELVLRNLAEAHGCRDDTITYEYLKEEFVDMHVKDWSSDEYSMGAFPFFSPGQFGCLYRSLNYPAAGGLLHFAGEALSTRHAAWRAVYEYLKVTNQDEKIQVFKDIWGENTEWSKSPMPKNLMKPVAHLRGKCWQSEAKHEEASPEFF